MNRSSVLRVVHPQNPPPPTLTDSFNPDALNAEFKLKTLEQRLQWAHEKYGDGLVLTSSFGVQSVLLIEAMQKAGIDLTVVTVDIPGEAYDRQREYRNHLQSNLGFRLYVAAAKDEDDKVAAMDRMLDSMGATAVLSGIRADQTANRAGKRYIEKSPRNGLVNIHPLLKWSDSKTAFYLEKVSPALRHPDYGRNVLTTGGAIVEAKTECGLHL